MLKNSAHTLIPERPLGLKESLNIYPKPRLQARMNGGTCIAAAIQKAGQLLKGVDKATDEVEEPEVAAEEGTLLQPAVTAPSAEEALPGARVLVLLTDGRVDSYQVPGNEQDSGFRVQGLDPNRRARLGIRHAAH